MSVVIGDAAAGDIVAAADWYHEREPQLRWAFLAAVDEAIRQIAHNPSQYQIVYRRFRRVLLNRFPYALFYVVSGEKIAVLACIHGRRNLRRILETR